MIASEKGHLHVVKTLIQVGADVNQIDKVGQVCMYNVHTPLPSSVALNNSASLHI